MKGILITDYYYVTVSNNYGTIVSKCAQVDFYSYVTLDFLNWDEADATVYKMESISLYTCQNGYYQKDNKEVLARMWTKGESHALLVRL